MSTIRPTTRLIRAAIPSLWCTAISALRVAPATPSITLHTPPHRSFFNLSGLGLGSLLDSSPVSISVTRTLPYSPSALYRLVSDVDSYSKFVPFCEDSKVTKWDTIPSSATPDAPTAKVPVEAYLRVGFLGVNETFTSRLICTPGHSVSALSGDAAIPHGGSQAISTGPLKSLLTKWTITPVRIPGSSVGTPTDTPVPEADQCLVQLDLKYDFRDPAKNIAGRAVSDAVAEKMIQAFEAQARRVIKGENVAELSTGLSGLNIPAPIKAFAKSQLQSQFGKK